jgi:hypothetical protein
MPSLNFSVFVDLVEAGLRQYRGEDVIGRVKRQTIREGERFKKGDDLYMFHGMRTKKCRRLGEAKCWAAKPIRMNDPMEEVIVTVADQLLTARQCEDLALADGFDSFADMVKFFKKRFPFKGQVVMW